MLGQKTDTEFFCEFICVLISSSVQEIDFFYYVCHLPEVYALFYSPNVWTDFNGIEQSEVEIFYFPRKNKRTSKSSHRRYNISIINDNLTTNTIFQEKNGHKWNIMWIPIKIFLHHGTYLINFFNIKKLSFFKQFILKIILVANMTLFQAVIYIFKIHPIILLVLISIFWCYRL